MKKILFLIVLGFLSTFLNAQVANKSVVPIINQTSDYIQLIEQKYGKQIVLLQYDVIKTSKETFRQLYAGVQYGIIAIPDGTVKDVNLKISYIKSDDWEVVAKDLDTEGIVMLFYTPTETGIYKLDVSASLANPDDFGYYSLIIFR